MSHRYCCAVSSRASVPLRGHWKPPSSSRLYSRRNPSPPPVQPFYPVPLFCHRTKTMPFGTGPAETAAVPALSVLYLSVQISIPTGNVYGTPALKVIQHVFKAWTMAWIICASALVFHPVSNSGICLHFGGNLLYSIKKRNGGSKNAAIHCNANRRRREGIESVGTKGRESHGNQFLRMAQIAWGLSRELNII